VTRRRWKHFYCLRLALHRFNISHNRSALFHGYCRRSDHDIFFSTHNTNPKIVVSLHLLNRLVLVRSQPRWRLLSKRPHMRNRRLLYRRRTNKHSGAPRPRAAYQRISLTIRQRLPQWLLCL